jgi:sugar lactone lactonase YvrE
MNRPAAILLMLTLSAAAFAQDVASHYREAIQAYRDGEPERMVDAARAALALRPDGASLIYLDAAASAWSGDTEHALSALERLADWGLSYQPDREPTFERLKDDKRFLATLGRFEAHRQPLGKSRLVRHYDDGHFIPEGIAYDADRDTFFLGSIHQRRIVTLTGEDAPVDLVPSDGHGLMSAFGMRLQGGRLLVATSGLPESGAIDAEQMGRAGILIFAASSGELIARHWLPNDGTTRVLGDLVVHGASVFTTDSATGQVWQLDIDKGQWTEMLGPGHLVSPQGLVLNANGSSLYVADYRTGVIRLDTESRDWQRLGAPANASVEGIDGLYRHGNDLIAIQNGIRPNRIIRMRLDEQGNNVTEVKVLASNLPDWDEPTLGTIVGDQLYYVANSHWPRFDAEGHLPPADELDGPRVMAVDL